MTTVPKTSLEECIRAALNFITLIPSYSVNQILANVLGLNSKRPSKFGKGKRKSLF